MSTWLAGGAFAVQLAGYTLYLAALETGRKTGFDIRLTRSGLWYSVVVIGLGCLLGYLADQPKPLLGIGVGIGLAALLTWSVIAAYHAHRNGRINRP